MRSSRNISVCARLLHNFETVFVVAMQNTRSHEREDRHNITEDGFWGKVGETRDEEESLVEGLGVIRHLKQNEYHLPGFVAGVTHNV